MKRGRFDAEYEKVSRRPAKPAEFPDDDMFERERAERAAAANEDFRRRMAALAEVEAQQKAENKARADANTRRSNYLVMMHEYEHAGVKPPLVNEDGTPSCSLSLLLQMGWSIERLGDSVSVLVRPIHDRSQRRSNNRQEQSSEADQAGEAPQ